MTKVYSVESDVEDFLWLSPVSEKVSDSSLLLFDGKSKQETWRKFKAYAIDPTKKEGDFYHIGPGALVVGERARLALAGILESSGELLPISFNKKTVYLHNIIGSRNALNADESTWECDDDSGERLWVTKHVFHKSRLGGIQLFKVPENLGGEVLLVEGLRDKEDEMRHIVKRCGLTGIKFNLLWKAP